MAKDKPSPKIGAGHASAMFRQGLSELRGALYNESNVAQPPQYGLYGTKTPGEVADDREVKERDGNEEPRSVVAERMPQAEPARDYGREPESPSPPGRDGPERE